MTTTVSQRSTPGRGAAPALIFIALNLRIAISALPPVLGQVRHSTGLTSAGGGLLTAVPVFCFGAAAFTAPWLIRRIGMSRLLACTMLAVVFGCLIRMASPLAALFAGTALLGAGIAVGNVIVPGLIKRDFHAKAVGMLSFYSLALCLGGAVSAGLTVPLENLTGLSWRPVVALWGIVAVVALMFWIPNLARERGRQIEAPEPVSGLWRDPTAWGVTLFMGLQSFLFYALLSWIPTLLQDHGASSGTAGWLLSFSMFPSTLAALFTPAIGRRLPRPRMLVPVTVVVYAAGLAGLGTSPMSHPYLWMGLIGVAQGSSLALALSYIVGRSRDSHQAAQLSTMAQGAGYLLACSGPFIVGALHGVTAGWGVPVAVLACMLVPMLLSGLRASRAGYVLHAMPPDS